MVAMSAVEMIPQRTGGSIVMSVIGLPLRRTPRKTDRPAPFLGSRRFREHPHYAGFVEVSASPWDARVRRVQAGDLFTAAVREVSEHGSR
jgi:hypothetical protein